MGSSAAVLALLLLAPQTTMGGPSAVALLLLAPKQPRRPRMAAIINPNNTPKRRRGLPPLPTALVRGGRRGTSLKAPPAVAPVPRLPIAKALAAFAALAASATLALSRLECSLPDAAWLVATTATTTGFGDVAPITPAGRAVCCGVALAGFGLVGTLAARVVDDWVARQRNPGRRRRRSGLRLGLAAACLLLFGAAGLRRCDGLAWGDALYLSVMVATTTGYGDVVPSAAGRPFAAAFGLLSAVTFSNLVGALAVAPLERELAAARRAALASYPELTPATLAELARGAVVTDLGLSTNSSNISRDEFTLLLLVKQGLVAPGDLDDARARFDALDADKTGVLSQADLDLAGDARRAASRPAGDDSSEPAA